MQHELEASFIYEDTPDQEKTTIAVKKDMESQTAMDRLVCGDVGFGKTEIAIRAAFKAVADSKQVAILVPTTILAMQHYKTFSERLKGFPCNIAYINRFVSSKKSKEILEDVSNHKIDILIGTHRLVGKDVKFKDLGLLIIDEEQKFGVAVKDKLKTIKANIDTLTLTATPIPRTLQFSLMGARDLSVITTPPPNRFPVLTELHTFNEKLIQEAITYELERGGQVFFVNNKVKNIEDVAQMIRRLCPFAKVVVGHGQMDGTKLEDVMISFMSGEADVLVATTIIESGLDISNANTIIINEAQNFGLSDLHQMRGRVGRSNKKAFCYLLSPPLVAMSDDARKRLQAIEQFSELGSGFNIAMRDLDIRGAGDILGGEQSGFMNELGFEQYQRILNEAIQELKEEGFSHLNEDDAAESFTGQKRKIFIEDCVIDTDLELLIPDNYVRNITERLKLYKELDSIEYVNELAVFSENLKDRFGKIPAKTVELIRSIELRILALNCAFEKLVIKNGTMLCYFVSDEKHKFYESEKFKEILSFMQNHPHTCKMKQNKNKLYLVFDGVKGISQAIDTIRPFADAPKEQMKTLV
jgi:transcription-repair coupling factor (superfamily II helicase)